MLSRSATKFVVQIAGLTSGLFKVAEVHQSLGSRKLDHAVLIYDLGAVDAFVKKLNLAKLDFPGSSGPQSLSGKQVTIYAENPDTKKRRVVHWGKITNIELDIGNEEGVQVISRIERTHFGRPVGFQKVWNPIRKGINDVFHPIVFNPEIDGKIVGNKRVPSDKKSKDAPLFIDPGSTRTLNANVLQGNKVADLFDPLLLAEAANENWSLADAVEYLCWVANDQTYIKNPTREQLQKILPTDRSILKNHSIRQDLYLNEALDELLHVYGFQFRIDHETGNRRRIAIVQNGNGKKQVVFWQKPGETLDLKKQNTDHVRIEYDASMAINSVAAYGGFTEIEATFELMPAWKKSEDTTPLSKLVKNGVVDWDAHLEYHRVWRDWVLNEAGDYNRKWSTLFKAGKPDTQAAKFLSEQFGPGHVAIVPKRRKFLPMLTLGDDGEPLGHVGGCDVEWYNPNRPGGLGAGWDKLWNNVPMFECRLLEHECGIRFTGTTPPIMIMNLGDQARVRITATYRSDFRIYHLAGHRNSTTNPDLNHAILDVGRRFHWRALHQSSKFYPDVKAKRKKANVADGREGLKQFAIAARDSYDQAQCSGNIRLEGCDHPQYSVGDLITTVQGRDIKLGVTNAGPGVEARYPQVIGLSYYPQDQVTLLTISEFKETDAMVGGLLHKTRRLP